MPDNAVLSRSAPAMHAKQPTPYSGYRFCECGESQARWRAELTVGSYSGKPRLETFYLCDDCAQEEFGESIMNRTEIAFAFQQERERTDDEQSILSEDQTR